MKRRKLLLETFEDRILCSVTAPAEGAADPQKDPALAPAPDGTHAAYATHAIYETHAATGTAEAAARHEIVFVDTSVEDYQKLVDAALGQSKDGVQMEVVLLDAERDGIEQINETLAGREDIDAIHFVTHATDRAVKFGSTWIDGAAFEQYRTQIATWGAALSADADLLFYGCDLAGSAAGRDLLAAFYNVTQADIAASTDDTGSAELGANWTLEYHLGTATTGIAFTQSVTETWTGVLNTFTVTNTNDAGAGSLRQAIIDANALAGTDSVSFNISGTGVHTITLASALPSITGTLTLDGTTDDSFAANGSRPAIMLDGNGLVADGLVLSSTADGSTVRGLVIRDFAGDGIEIQAGSDNNFIVGNYIGRLTSSGTDAGAGEANTQNGVLVRGAGNTIGGTTAADRNVISGNTLDGVRIDGGSGNLVEGNYIGTDATGLLDVGNAVDGVFLDNAANNNTIGGSAPGSTNIIAGNDDDGIQFRNGSSNNRVEGNWIGIAADGTTVLGHLDDGIRVQNDASVPTGNLILGNRIAGSGNQGIDIGADGVTLNDAGDGDAGSNTLQNFPVLTSALRGSNSVTISGTLNSTASSTFRLEFFANTTGDPTGYGEGQRYLGFANVTTNASGNASYTVTLASAVSLGELVSATATSSTNNTSEFSANTTVVGNSGLWISTDGATAATAGGLQTWTDGTTVRFSNPNLALGSGTTAGTFSQVFEIDGFAADGNADINGLEYVTRTVVVGTVNPVTLQAGDVLLSTAANETLGGVSVTSRDVVLFRPTTPGDYSSGTFSLLLRNPGSTGNNVRDFALVEAPITIGGTNLQAGDFLLVLSSATYDKDISLFRPTSMSTNPTGGTLSELIDGGSAGIGFGQQIHGLELIERTTTLGGQTLQAGQILVALNGNDTVGTNALSVTPYDVFALSVTATGTGASSASAAMIVRGSNIGLSSGGENVDGLALITSVAPVITLPGGALAYTENNPATVIDGAATVTDSDSGDFSTGTLSVDYSANGSVDDLLAIRNEGTGAGQIGVSGANVTYGGVTIGTFTGGSGTTPLVITFNANATPAAAQALARNITYANVSDAPSTLSRTVRFVVTDGEGGTSTAALKTINVTALNDAPRIDDATTSLQANSPNGTAVTNVNDFFTGADTDLDGQALTYSFTGGNTGSAFAINPATGAITVNSSVALDFATTPIFTLTVQASDGTLSDTAVVTVNLQPGPLGGGVGSFAVVQGNRLYSVSFDTGKATLLATSPYVAGTINSLGFDQVNGIFYYADSANSGTNKALYGYDARSGTHFILTADVTTFGVVLPSGGLGAAGGDYINGSYYFSTEGGGSGGADQIFKLDFVGGSNGRTVQSITRIAQDNFSGGTEFGDFIVDATNNRLYLFNSSTGVDEYVLTPTPSTYVARDAFGNIRQAARDRFNRLYNVDTGFQIYTPGPGAAAGSLGAITNITTDGTTSLGAAADAGAFVEASASIGDRVWYDTDRDGVQDGGENGAVGVTVTLYDDVNGNGIIEAGDRTLGTTTTGANGAYVFNYLLPGSYIISVTDPTNIMQGAASTTGGTQQTASISLIGQAVTTKDFGFENPATITVSNPVVTEGTSTHAVFTVSLSNALLTPVTMNFALANGSATGADYGPGLEVSTDGGGSWTAASSATFAAGTTSVLVRTPILNDALDEAAESFTLTATRTAGPTANLSAVGTATITDDDPTPSLTISDVTRNEAAGTATFTVTLSAVSGQSVSVNYATSNGTATAGADFTGTSGTLSFSPGVTSQTITVSILNDAIFENSETFNVNLSAPVNATIADALGVGTIRDDGTGSGGTDNDTPTLSVSSPAVSEGIDAYAIFTVALTNASTTAVTVGLALTAGTATGADYGPGLEVSTNGGGTWVAAASATIAAGSTSVLVRTPIINDTLDEAAETFTLTATRTAGTTTNASAIGTATITDNDPTPSLSINDVTVNEAAGTATFTVTLNTASGQSVSVNYATSNGTATAGADFTSASGTLNFATGVTTQTITVPILNDATFESSEAFNVDLSAPVNATIADAFGIGTIKDDGTGSGGTDNDTPTLSVSSPAVTEGADSFAAFTVSLSNASTTAVSVSLALANGTALGGGTDFGTAGAGNLQVSTDGGGTWADAGSATIAAGSTSVLVRTPLVNDALDEAAETFTLTATRTAGTTTNASASGTATITDDDATPSLTINDLTINEAAGTATFTVTLNTPSGQVVSVNYATSNGTATAGADFTMTSGTLNFAAGVTTQTITVPILNDAIFENSETFNVNLSGAVNASIADALGVGTIRDDGTGAGGTDNDTPTLAVSSPNVTEGTDGFAVFTVSLSNTSTTPVSVSLALANGTALGGGTDYGTGGAGNLQVSTDGGVSWADAAGATIAAGSTSVLVRTPLANDALDEAAETFTLTATRTAGTTTNASAMGTAPITDEDLPPSVSVNDVTINEAAGTATFTVTFSAPSGQAATVTYATSNGTATSGADYTAAGGTLNFAAGVTSQTITVPILNDAVFENSETFNVLLTGSTNAIISDGLGIGTIKDDGTGSGGTDNDTPTLAVSSPNVTEGTDGFATFTVSLSNASTTPVSTSLALANVTALGGGTDYGTAGAGNLQVSTDGGATWADASSATIAAGSTSVLVRTPIVNDALDETGESFTLTATRTAGTTTNASASGTALITDDDATPSLTINDVTVNEAAGTAAFTVTLNAVSGQAVSVNYATSNGTASAGSDFTATSGTLNFAPGVTSQTVTVTIANDATFEGSENFNVNLSAAVNATIADNLGAGTILDDGTGAGGTDNDTPTLAVSSPNVTEGTDGFATFTVSLSNPSTTPVSVNLALANVTALGGGTDFGTAGAGNLQVSTDGGATWADGASATIAAGSTSVLVRTPIVNDALDEPAETFTLTATRTAGTTTNASANGTATIADDDVTPSLAINDITVNEAAGTATFTVTLSAPSGQPVSVNYATSDGTAAAGADYTAAAGTLNFAAGVTSQTITVPILNDALFENSETFNVTLSSAVSATIADNTGTGTIKDDGTGAGGTDNDTPSLTVSNVSVTEGTDTHAVFTVALSNASTTAVVVNLALANGTATGGGVDFGAALEVSTDGGATWGAAGSATIAAGSTSVLVRTPVVNDALNEAAETFTLTATRTGGATTNASAIGSATIVDNDALPTLSINDVTVNESAGTATFTVSLNTVSGQPVSVSYATGNGTAIVGADFTGASGTLNFAAGVTSQTVTVSILNDTTFESSENFNVLLSGAINATISDGTGLGTIRDDGTGAGGTDNDTPALVVSNVSVTEGTDPHAIFTVSLSNLSTTPVSVNLALANGTATGGGVDYGAALEVSTDGGASWTAASSTTIAAGSTSVLVRTPIANDTINEAAETFTLTATRFAGTTTNLTATGTATIVDNDALPAFSINDVTVNEGAGTATFTVTLNTASGRATSVNYATSNGTATAGADYSAGSGTLNFAAGVTSQTVVVSILDDVVFEGSETFNVTLSGAVNALIADGTGLGTILDNGTGGGGTDDDRPSLNISNPSITEDIDPFAVFTLTLSNASTTPVVMNLALANGTALGGGVDYGTAGAGNLQVSTNGGATWVDAASVTFAPGTTSVLARTPIFDDGFVENGEDFDLVATVTSGNTLNASATGTANITDDDGGPTLTIDDVTVNEGAGTATFTISMFSGNGKPIYVTYTTNAGTATAGVDYTNVTGTVYFAPGAGRISSETFTVPISNDAIFEGGETFTVTLSDPIRATITDGLGIGTIVDDGTGTGGTDDDRPTLSVSNVAVTEGTDTRAVFAVNLSNISTTPVTVNLALANGTATGGGTDFGPGLEVSTDGGASWTAGTTATIAAGSTSVLVRTPIANDVLDEAAETFTLTATRTAGTTANLSATGTATINDDDPSPSLTINDVTVNEAAGSATFTVTLNAVSGRAVSVNYATAGATAAAGADFTTTTGVLNFAAGTTTQTITVPILNDAIFEGSETFNVLLSAPTNATLADGTGVGTILDAGNGPGGTDNDTPTLSVTNTTSVEGSDPFEVFAVSLSNLSTTDVSFNLALTDGTAAGGGVDFGTAGAGNLQVSTDGGASWTDANAATIAAGTLSVLVRTPVVDDALFEAAEDFTLTATVTAGATTNVSASGAGTIADNDGEPTLSIDDVTVNEAAGTATFTVWLNTPSGLPVTVSYATASGTATGGADFTTASGVLFFNVGETTQTITVPIFNDAVFEQSEAFDVTLGAPLNAIIADGTGVGTIRDDGTGVGGADNDTPTLSVTNVGVTEGVDAHAVFSIDLSNVSTTPVIVGLALANGSATGGGIDYGTGGAGDLQVSTDNGATWSDANSVTIAAGVTSVLVRTPITDDPRDENAETFTLTATVTGGTTANAAATGTATIADDDATPSVSIDDVVVNEKAGTATFTVTLSAASELPVTLNYVTSGSSAVSGTDFASAAGTLNFAAGVISQTITVSILDDTIFEQSESYDVLLSGEVNATIADGTGVGTILDDGTGSGGTDNDTPTLSVMNVVVTEGTDTTAVFMVKLSNASTTPVSVSLALADGNATGGGTDYGPGLEVSVDGGASWTPANTATFAPGSTSVLVRTPVADDLLDEQTEDFILAATVTAGITTNASADGSANILDDDATPTLAINDVTVNEGAGTMTFTVTLSAPSGQAVSVNYATSSGTATTGADFTGTSGTLNFAAGVTSQTVTVAISNDIVFEGSESFDVLLSDEVNASIADGTGAGTILDDGTGAGGTNNDTPTFSVSNVTATEGTDTHAVFAVSLSNLSTTAVTVSLALADGTAIGGGTDFGAGLEVSTDGGATWAPSATATIAAGSASVLVRTPLTDDALNEAAETFTLTATRTAGTTINAAATGTATIVDNDALPTLSIDDVTVNEGAGTATFTVMLNAPSGQTVEVDYATGNGTAVAGADFTGTNGTLVFAPGVTSQTITVSIVNDTIFELSENFSVMLSDEVNATIADGAGVGTILDDGTGGGGTDNDTPSLSVSNVTVTEGTDTHAVFAVNLSNASTTPVDVSLALANGTATGGGVDFGAALEVSTDGGVTWSAAATATIAAGSTGVLVRTPITDDAVNEAAESFTLTATRAGGTTTNADATGIATIVDNDAQPALSIDDVTVNEAAGTATFTVTLSAASEQAVLVSYAAGSGTALVGADFTASSGALNFAPGVTSQTVTVPITNDAIFEGSENFAVTLAGAVNATIADATGAGTILDDGTGGGGTDNDTPSVSVSSVAVTEGVATHAEFSVNLSNPSTTPVSVNLALADGTATGGGTDFGAGLEVSTDGGGTWVAASSATIAAGSTSVLVRTPIVDDALNEAAENFTLTATVAAGSTTNAVASGTGTIADNDGPPTLSIDDVTVNEAAGTATFTVSLSSLSGQTVTVDYTTSNGTAAAALDFTANAGTLTFAPGVTSQTVTVAILDDAIFENSEAFFVLLTNSTNAAITDDTGIGTIRDDGTGTGGTDNDTPTLSVSGVTTTEGLDTHAVFTVSLSNRSTTDVNVSLALAAGSATGGGTDFGAGLEVSTDGGMTWTATGNTTIEAGSTSVLARTTITDDALDEATEDFTLTATVTGGTTTNISAIATATIADDDATPTLTIDDVTVNEGAGTATFTVTLSAASGLPVSVGYTTSDTTTTAGADYTATGGTLNFAPGETSKTITVSISNDLVFERSEHFDVILSAPVNATIAEGHGDGFILDDGTGTGGTDDDTPTLSVSNVSVTEGADAYAVFAVTLSNASTTPVDLSLALANGTATGGGMDFGPGLEVSTDSGATWTPGNNATFAPGNTSVLVRAPITDDLIDENSENFTLSATVTSGITANPAATGTATIADDDAMPALTINDVTVNEAAGTATFTVTLSAASGLPVSVNYTTADGTAAAGSDFTGTSGTLNFAAGVTSQTITVSIQNDAIFEQSESFNVLLSGEVNATIADGSALGTILDDGTGGGGTDNDTPTLSVSNVSATEGTDPHAVFAVTLSNASTTPVNVSLALADGAATGGGVDFGAGLEVSTDGGITWTPTATATIAAGSTSVLVRTPVIDDAIDENSEDFTLTATVTGGTTTNVSASGTAAIADDDATPTLSIDDVTVNEAAGTATFTVTLSAASGLPVSVNYATADGTAATGADYTGTFGALNFAAGVTSQTVTVSILNDAIFEGNEAFNVLLSSAVNATIADDTGVGTIRDDGTGTGGTDNDTPTLSVSNTTVTEGTDPHAVFTVSLSNASTTPVNVSLALADGTATGGAVDFGAGLEVSTDGGATWAAAASAIFAPGSTSVLVRTPIIDDPSNETPETFSLTATVTGGTTVNPSATGTATIIDNEAPPALSIDDLIINESAGTATFTVSLSAPSGFPVSVNYASGNGAAKSGSDYTAAGGTLNFAVGVTSQTVTISILDDALFENGESFSVTLSAAVNATIADDTGVATILDDDVRQASLSLVGTSDLGTSGSNVVVGEVVTYELQLELGEGANDWVTFWEGLPTGLQFLPNAPVIVGFTNVASSVTGLAADSYTNATADAMISASLSVNDDTYGDGTDVYFQLGSLTNNDSDADREFVTVRFSAVVTNSLANQGGALHDNRFAPLLDTDGNGSPGFVSIDRDGDNAAAGTEVANDALNDATGTPAFSNDVTIQVVEPILVVDKQITSAPAAIKAGDTIVYTVTLSHAAGSGGTAWEATLADAVPVGLQISQIDSVTLSGGAQEQSAAAIGGGGATLGGVWDIPAGGSVTVVYRATVTSDAVLGSTLSNLADLTWSSLDGASADERASGDGLLDAGGLNDYQLQATSSATIDGGAGAFSLDKQVIGDSNAEIGERLTYQLTLKVADGIINSISLNDLIPAGFTLVNGSAQLTAGAGVAVSGASFTYAANQLTLDIAQLQSSVDGVENTITITYAVDVLDSAANDAFGGAGVSTKTNFADASYDPGSGLISAADSVTVNVVEPVIAATESVTSAPAKPNAGDTITFQVVIGHGGASSGNAYNVIYTDTLPADFGNVQLVGVSGTAGTLPTLSDFMIVGNTIVTLNPFDIELGTEVVLTYSAVIQDTVTPGAVLTNNAAVTAQSTNTSPSVNARSTGSPTNGANYGATGAASLTADSTFDLAKIANVSTARVGDRVHYTITVTVIEGTTPSLVLTDTLPNGPAIDAGSIQIAYGAPGMSSSNGTPASIAGNTLTLDFATLTNAGDNDATNDTITIEYDEVVTDNAGNNNGDVKTNVVDGTYTGLGVSVTASADVTIIEPVLDIVKTVNDDTPHLGQTITYTLVITHNGASTADAFDLTLNDALPAGVSLNAASITLASAPAGTAIVGNTSVDGGALQLALNQLALGESVTITFTATVSVDPAIIGGTFGGADDMLSSTVALGYDTQAGANPDQRALAGSAANMLTVVGADLAVTKSDGQATATAGDQLTYTITVTNNGTDAATNVIVTDTLPASDVIFNSAGSTPGSTVTGNKVVYLIPSLAAGATATFTVVVDVANPTSAGLESIANLVDVQHDDIEPTAADNTVTDTDTLLSAPDYTITVTDNRTSAKPGEVVNYVITVTNIGNQNGTGVVVGDAFTTGVFSSVVADQGGAVDLVNGSVVWNVGALAAGDSITLTLRGTVNATFTTIPMPVGTLPGAVPDNDAIAHTLDVLDDGAGGADPTPANNMATDLDDLQPAPELKITQTDSVTIGKPGQLLTYQIVATNAGSQDSNGMIVTDTLPVGVKLVSISSSDPAMTGTPVVAGGVITWNFPGTMPAGESITFTVVVRVDANAKPGSELLNHVTIADDGFYGPDVVTMSDNAASDMDRVPEATPVPAPKPAPRPAPAPAPFVFAFDTFHNFADEGTQQFGELPEVTSIDLAPAAILPLVPIYSGEADPGATLIISLYNARGERIGSQTVMVDAGGNWLATFPSTNTRDIPNSVQITMVSAPYSLGESSGHNLRTYFSPAINPGHFFLGVVSGGSIDDEAAPLLGGLNLENPLQLGAVKYGLELLGTQATASGY